MTGAQEPWGGGERRSLLRRVLRMLTPWSNRHYRADRADAAAEEAISQANDIHREARKAIRDARDVAAQYRAADERLGHMSGRR